MQIQNQMFKLLFLALISFSLHAEVNVKWMGVASIALDDGTTTILFDPMFTRASASHWFGFEKFKSDEILVQKMLTKYVPQKIDALFVSHSHFDHAIDAPIVSKLTGATFYVDQNTEKIAKAYKDPSIKLINVLEHKKIKIGNFTITPIKRKHDKILGLLDFLPGDVPSDFDFGFYQYKLGDLWLYLIEHPEGTILLDESPGPFLEGLPKELKGVDIVIQGIANRRDDDAILKGYAKVLSPKAFLPLHFDNFLFPLEPQNISLMPGMNKESLLNKMTKEFPALRVIDPKFGERYQILISK